jgi:propanediol dehydratase large subunit
MGEEVHLSIGGKAMSSQDLSKLVAHALKDDSFRMSLLNDPEEAVKAAGYTLTEEEWEAIRNIDLAATQEELEERVSKFWGFPAQAIGGFEA